MLMESKTVGTEDRLAEAGEGLMVYHGPALGKFLGGWSCSGSCLWWCFQDSLHALKSSELNRQLQSLLYTSYTFKNKWKVTF